MSQLITTREEPAATPVLLLFGENRMHEFTHSKNKNHINHTATALQEVFTAPIGEAVAASGRITVIAPAGSIVRAENHSTVRAQAGSIVQGCHGSTIVVEGKCVIFQFGGARIEHLAEALVISPSAITRVPHIFRVVTKDQTFGDNLVLIVKPGVHVKCGKNCQILAFEDTIVEAGDDSRVLSDHGCVVKTGKNSFVRAGDRTSIYTGANCRIKCGDGCIVRSGCECRVTAGKDLNARLVNG